MHVVYDVSHNIAKVEEHMVDGELMKLLVHRKGSTRAFPPHHPLIPVDYHFTGVLLCACVCMSMRMRLSVPVCVCLCVCLCACAFMYLCACLHVSCTASWLQA